jgi:alpha-1,2-mannosyltransferase
MKLPPRLQTCLAVMEPRLAYVSLILCWLAFVWFFFDRLRGWISRFNQLTMSLTDPACRDSQYDFSMFWSAGKMMAAHNNANVYDPQVLLQWRNLHLCTNSVPLPWINLPPALLPSYAVSFLPFKQGLIVWLLVSIIGAVILLRLAKLSWIVVIAGLLSPAALFCLGKCQLGVIMDAFFVLVLMRSDERPWQSGIMLGMLIFKPQEALLAPFALLARRNWRAIFMAASTVTFILLCTVLVFNVSVWKFYWQTGRHVASQILFDNTSTYKTFGISVFWMLRSLGASIDTSLIFQGLSFCFAGTLVWHVWQRQNVSKLDRMALTVFLSLLATPYGYTHDMVGYSVALACLAERRGWRLGLLDVLFWVWPLLCVVVIIYTGVLLTPVVVGLAIIRTWLRAGLGVPGFSPSLGRVSTLSSEGS